MVTFDRYREVFSSVAFRRFWLGFSFSALGDGMTRVALIWFVYDATGSARSVGWLLLSYTGPIVIGGLMAGVLLDRYERRLVMLVDNLIRGAALALIPLLHWLDRLEVWHVYAIAAIYGLLMMISLAGGPSLVPTLVPDVQLPTANALEMLSFTISGVLGPPLAGLLIAAIGAPNVVIIDVASYVVFAGALAGIRVPEAVEAAVAGSAQRLGDAVRLLLRNPVLLSTTAMFLVFNIGGGMLAVWLPVLARDELGGGAALYGVLLGMMAAGEVAASLVAGAVDLHLPLGTMICLAQIASGAALLILLASETLLAAAAGMALFGACSAPLTIWAQTLRMRVIPERLRGRSFALLRTLMQSGGPAGGALGGLLLPALGIPAMILASAMVVGGPGMVGMRVRELREADGRSTAELTLPVATEAHG